MKVEIISQEHGGETLYHSVVDGKKTNHLFFTEAEAYIFAGLYSSMSINDASYLSRYISAMIKGIKQ